MSEAALAVSSDVRAVGCAATPTISGGASRVIRFVRGRSQSAAGLMARPDLASKNDQGWQS